MHFHDAHAGGSRARPVQPGPDGLRDAPVPGAQIPAPFPELMKLGRVNPQNLQGAVLHDGAGAEAVARGQRRERTARAGQPAHVAMPLSRTNRSEQVPIGHITNGIHLLGWMKGTVRRFWRRKLTGEQPATPAAGLFGGPTGRIGPTVNSPEFWQRMADPEFYFGRGNLGLALQAAPRTDRVCAAAAADPAPAADAGRFHRVRSTAQSRRADHRLRAAVCDLQTRAADLSSSSTTSCG